MGPFRTLALLAILGTTVYALPNEPKDGKAIGIFNVVRFPNDVCNTATTMNGTCYTAEECSDRKGVATGSCADGFGVCCVITLTCGETTSENCTYLTLAASATVASTQCTYTICPASSTVSRIRLDLTMFNIAAPYAVVTTGLPTDSLALEGGAIGHCTMDTFQVAGSGGGSPVICGNNDGQHMIVDTDGAACVTASFSFGSDTATRNYRIHAIQYDRLNEMGGPAGCLQFFTGTMGTVSTFNWATAATSTHLANQDYKVCVRRLADSCSICWSPIISGMNAVAADATATPPVVAAAAARGSFGVSISAITGDATTGATCATDYIVIPNGLAADAAATDVTAAIAANQVGFNRFCGRYLNTNADTTDGTVCSRVTPFSLSVVTNGGEVVDTNTAVAKANTNEASAGEAGTPTGTMGFSLGFAQIAC